MVFWAIAIGMGGIIAAILARPLLRDGPDAAPDTQADQQVYRDQLKEVESDLARGVLSPDEADALRTEVSRRLLGAAEKTDAAGAQQVKAGNAAIMAGIVAIVVIAGAFGIYAGIGASGAPDLPLEARLAQNAADYADRPTQAEMADFLSSRGSAPEPDLAGAEQQLELIDQLKSILENRPEDARGHELLAGAAAGLGLWTDAADAQAALVRIRGAEATAADHADLAEFLILAVNGYVSPEAEAALRAALTMDPNDQRARYFSGLSALQAGRADITYDLWTRLLVEGPRNAPWIGAIEGQIADVAAAAGRPIPEVPGAAGPTRDDVAAAADLSPAERMEMVRGMVDRLSDRLATEGGTAQEWARLISSLGVLGERGRANRIWTEAREVFADDPNGLQLIRQAAQDAEIIQ